MTDVNKALSNLESIKNGDDPRSSEAASKQSVNTPEKRDALSFAEEEINSLYRENDWITNVIPRGRLHVGVARWDGRNGVCKYNNEFDGKRRFNKKMSSLPRKQQNHVIVINEKIFDQGNVDEFVDTLLHEVAHAIAYEKHDKYPSRKKYIDYDPHYAAHGGAWKHIASEIGADPSSCHNKRDRSDEYEYYIYCPECDTSWGKTKRSKKIKLPFKYGCGCGHSPLSSYEAGDKSPDKSGVVAVESIPWNDKSEWYDEGCP